VSPLHLLGVAIAGTVVALDVTSVPQAMISRPLVAGLLGGAAAGAPLPGLALGALLELFAMETLPVGASRYPDWGPGAVAVGALAGARALTPPGVLALVLLATLGAWAGGWMTHWVRRANTDAVAARHAALDAGDPRALGAIQRGGLLRDAVRGLVLTALVFSVGEWLLPLVARRPGSFAAAQIALAGTSVGVALHAGLRLAGRGKGAWLAGGVAAGALVAVLWLR
jgi:mannose/fructose/N-acetylgalactosamine-specific phosphotransferase system component IIC